MNEVSLRRHLLEIRGECEFALLGGLAQQGFERGPGGLDLRLEPLFGRGRDVIGDDIDAAEQEAGGPARADEPGPGDADGLDLAHVTSSAVQA